MDLQVFVDVAGTEDPVNAGELLRVVRREVRSEDAVLSASPPQQLAGRARRHRPLLPPSTLLHASAPAVSLIR